MKKAIVEKPIAQMSTEEICEHIAKFITSPKPTCPDYGCEYCPLPELYLEAKQDNYTDKDERFFKRYICFEHLKSNTSRNHFPNFVKRS